MTGIIFIIIGIFSAFIGKAVADKVTWHWNKSIFRKFSRTGFFGPPQFTSERKYESESRIKRFLMSTIFVAFTDIWHLSNLVNKIGWFMMFVAALTMYPTWLGIAGITALLIVLSLIGFHILFHWTLDVTRNNVLRALLTLGLVAALVFGTGIINGWVKPKKVEEIKPTMKERLIEIQSEIKTLEEKKIEIDSTINDLNTKLDSTELILLEPERKEATDFLKDFTKLDIKEFVKNNF